MSLGLTLCNICHLKITHHFCLLLLTDIVLINISNYHLDLVIIFISMHSNALYIPDIQNGMACHPQINHMLLDPIIYSGGSVMQYTST